MLHVAEMLHSISWYRSPINAMQQNIMVERHRHAFQYSGFPRSVGIIPPRSFQLSISRVA